MRRRLGRRAIPEWWGQAVDEYIRFLARNGRRPKTAETYQSLLVDFGERLLADHIPGLDVLTSVTVERWQDTLPQWASPRTQRVASTAVRGLLRWAADQDRAPAVLWLRVGRPRVPRLLPRPIPAADLAILEASLGPADPHDEARLRVRALFFVLFSSGARISEALQLRRDSLRDGAASVIQKGGAPHTMVVSARAQAAITDYLAVRTDDSPALFYEHEKGRPLDAKDAQADWTELCLRLGIRRFTSHRIRHTTATTMLAQGVDWLVIARHLGHRSLQAIQGYAEVAMASRYAAVALLDQRLAG